MYIGLLWGVQSLLTPLSACLKTHFWGVKWHLCGCRSDTFQVSNNYWHLWVLIWRHINRRVKWHQCRCQVTPLWCLWTLWRCPVRSSRAGIQRCPSDTFRVTFWLFQVQSLLTYHFIWTVYGWGRQLRLIRGPLGMWSWMSSLEQCPEINEAGV